MNTRIKGILQCALGALCWGASGIDTVEFLISTNPGADFAPLAKIASGGELSRFILSLKVARAEEGGAATIIFDEGFDPMQLSTWLGETLVNAPAASTRNV